MKLSKNARTKSVSYEEGLIEQLKDAEFASEYLSACVLDAPSEDAQRIFLMALGRIARAHGVQSLAKATELSRDALYKALSANGNPGVSLLFKLFDVLNMQIKFEPKKRA